MVTLTAAVSFHCRLHYAEAVLSELFRVSAVAPVTPPHRATKDTTLKGYFIPKVCIDGSVISETCSLATQLHLQHQGDEDGVGYYNSCDAAVCPRRLYRVLSLWKLQDIYGELVSRVSQLFCGSAWKLLVQSSKLYTEPSYVSTAFAD